MNKSEINLQQNDGNDEGSVFREGSKVKNAAVEAVCRFETGGFRWGFSLSL